MTEQKEYTLDELELKYDGITVFYDYAEGLLDTIDSDLAADPEEQLKIIEPLVSEIGDATDVLAEEFVFIAESVKRNQKSRANKAQIEAALRKLYNAVHAYQDQVKDIAKQASGSFMNIADAIVKKIERQIEEAVLIFMEFVNISLHSVMGKVELEELKLRNDRIAAFMHQQAQIQQ